jgi:Fe-S-cluster containining protein
VYFTRSEERALADHLGLTLREIRRRYLRREGGYRVARAVGDTCVFLRDCRCSIYPVRPVPCRTWPFWPENMKRTVWDAEVKPFCRGVGQGPRITRQEIEAAMRLKADHDIELDEE